MNSTDPEYQKFVIQNLTNIYNTDYLPISHQQFLEKLKNEYNFTPKVCYDIGSLLLHWTRHAKRIWPDTKIVLFDAFQPAEVFYNGYDYSINVLSNIDNNIVNFYQNDMIPFGNSYYRETGFDNGKYFPENIFITKKTRTLDSIVMEKDYMYPDLIKIDVQGAELDILKGAHNTLLHAKFLIIELQHVEYNKGAPLCDITIQYLESIGWECIARKFSDNGPDADYCFINLQNN
jgi:FkbM family methyltransferase